MFVNTDQYSKYIRLWLIFMIILIVSIVGVGGLTRLTDSGLSITAWELFSGILPPFTSEKWDFYFNEYKQIPEFKILNFDMTLDEFKVIFYWEWGHRILARFIGLFSIIPLIFIFLSIKRDFFYEKKYYSIFLLICFQGFIGWYMVSSGLVDRIDVSHFRLSIHLIIAFFILSMIFWNYLKINNTDKISKKINSFIPLFFLVLIFIQIVVGAFVSGMDAGKIYNSWPYMGNSYFPNDNDLINLFSLSAFSDPSLVQFMHRNLAYVILVSYLIIFYKIYKNKMIDLYKSINILGCFILLQIILGIFTLIYGAQIYIASMHQISSIFLVSSCIYFFYLNTKSS